ncbi:MAG TPA: ferritin-like protein [Acidimicrobiales bacterium]|nr:ferritin-like protein [Acidimicrobiales bacterium]
MITLHRSILEGLHHDEPDPESVRCALQRAVELEHSTIPVYLYAYYSLDTSKNAEAARILKSVVVEEMLHMVLAANVLNAIGGRPAIGDPDFIPRFPGHLPGGVEGQVRLHLRPFSRQQLEAFIEVEEPRSPIDYEAHAALVDVPSVTIGEFYMTISNALQRLPVDAFTSPPRNQVGPDLMLGSINVVDRDSAVQAIATIIEQGEGTTTSPEEVDGPDGQNDYAHFYRLSELMKGRRLVKVPDAESRFYSYEFSGDVISLDPSGVYDVPLDPTANTYPVGSAGRRLNDAFNFTYTTLLAQLHDLLNGENDMATFMSSLATMSSLEDQARIMVSGTQSGGVPIGPTFEYQPEDPADR